MDPECNIKDEDEIQDEIQEKIFHDKVKYGLVEDVKSLLKGGVSAKTSFRFIPVLHSAVEYSSWAIYKREKPNYLKIATLLLDYGADLNIRDKHGRTSLQLALLHGDLDMVQVLLNKKLHSKIDKKNGYQLFDNDLERSEKVVDFLLKNGNGFKITQKEYPILLQFAAQNGDETSFKKILMTNGDFDINSFIPLSYSTIFHSIIEKGTCNMIKIFVNHGAEVNKKDRCGDTPLHTAIKLKRFLHVSCLLEYGASVFDTDAQGETALHLAVKSRADAEIIQMILSKGIDINVKNKGEETPLHLACQEDVKTVKNLLRNGGDLNAENILGEIPFHKACAEGNIEIVSFLENIGVDINISGYENRTALHYIIFNYKNINVIEFLLLKGIDVNAVDINGKTALHYIVFSKSREDLLITKLLIKHGANINAKDIKGNTVLHDISKHRNFHDLIDYCLKLKADINAENLDGETPFSYLLQLCFHPVNRYFLSSNIKSLVAHLTKMIALQLYVCEKNVQSLEHETVSNLYRACTIEISEMKRKIGNSNISLLDFLVKDVSKLIAFIRNEEISEALSSYSCEENFPNYVELLERRIRKAKRKALLLKSTEYVFNVRLKAKLPEIVLDQIVRHLKRKELISFVEAFRI